MQTVSETSRAEFLEMLRNGQKEFEYLDFQGVEAVSNMNLSRLTFRYCWMFFNFKECNLRSTQFISCNLKTVCFDNVDLSNGLISGCQVEAMSLVNSNIEGLRFEGNWYHGGELIQDDLKWFAKPIGK